MVTLQDSSGEADFISSVYGAMRCRIVTIGWSITYTGNTLDNSGSITVNSLPMDIGDSIMNPTTFTVYNNQSGTDKNWSANQLRFRTLLRDINYSGANSEETRTFALRDGAHGVLRHTDDEYKWVDLDSSLTFLGSPTNNKLSALVHSNIGPEGQLQHWPAVQAFDSGWTSTSIVIRGAQPGASFLLDTIYCVEYLPTNRSDVYAIAKNGPPPNPKALEYTSAVARKMPIASQGNAASNTAIDFASSIAKVASAGYTFGSHVAPLLL